jgi:6,7-dimethyl-8-ribityllumazine synthase
VANTILIVWSKYYEDLAKQQLESCLPLLKSRACTYDIEEVKAGTYEIPVVIQHYQSHFPYDAYLPLGLLLKGSTDHYEFIWEHVKTCFIEFAMHGVCIGNGIISAPNMEVMKSRVANQERVQEAVRAIDYLLSLKEKVYQKVL